MKGIQKFVYRIELKDDKGETGNFLAEIDSDDDETARRHIIATEYASGNCVKKITTTKDKKSQPNEWHKRCY